MSCTSMILSSTWLYVPKGLQSFPSRLEDRIRRSGDTSSRHFTDGPTLFVFPRNSIRMTESGCFMSMRRKTELCLGAVRLCWMEHKMISESYSELHGYAVCLFFCLSVRLSVFLFACQSRCLPDCSLVMVCLSTPRSVFFSVYLFVILFVYLAVSICLPTRLHLFLFLYQL